MSIMPPPIQTHTYPTPHRSSGLGIALGLAIGLMIMLISAGIGFIAGFLAGQNYAYDDSMPFDATAADLDVNVGAPTSIEVGDVFTVALELDNGSESARPVTSVDVASSLLAGLSVIETDPETITVTDPYSDYEYAEHTVEATVPPYGSTTITLTCRADMPGTFSGDIDVYVDGWNVITGAVAIEITGDSPKARPRW